MVLCKATEGKVLRLLHEESESKNPSFAEQCDLEDPTLA